MAKSGPKSILQIRPEGLYCAPGGFFIDPHRPVHRAVITHGHADHARPGNGHVLATRETLAIMQSRFGAIAKKGGQAAGYGETVTIGDARVRLVPAGHVLGSAQAVIDTDQGRVVVSGDYKRRRDPTCAEFETVPCDLYVTEATFGLPVFRHPESAGEIGKLIRSLETFPDRAHLVGAYALGKAQRVIKLLREAGYDRPIHLHGAMRGLCDLYQELGVDLGPLEDVETGKGARRDFGGEIVLCPPSALRGAWSRRFGDAVAAFASGWMTVRQRAKQSGVELPLVLSDHADWDELTATIRDVEAETIWVTHGREEALVHQARLYGLDAEALSVAGFEEEGQ
ncbi:MAG: ligase-associated DNA damage response exonuclease [Alphaproteobacteria bacterium]|nr:ligase-associated DNA damage response exonuclease [Alphaproteobacteria bacterium]